jgi:hypothetical protein
VENAGGGLVFSESRKTVREGISNSSSGDIENPDFKDNRRAIAAFAGKKYWLVCMITGRIAAPCTLE